MRYALETIGANKDDILSVVSNNHHFRVLPFEKRIPFYKSLKYIPSDYMDDFNLLAHVPHMELSHHLAHAYSAICTSPYENGVVLVMDGMGESYQAMIEDLNGIEPHSGEYMHDIKILKKQNNEKFVGQPMYLSHSSGYREAETAYYFDGGSVVPVFKRWSRERSP